MAQVDSVAEAWSQAGKEAQAKMKEFGATATSPTRLGDENKDIFSCKKYHADQGAHCTFVFKPEALNVEISPQNFILQPTKIIDPF